MDRFAWEEGGGEERQKTTYRRSAFDWATQYQPQPIMAKKDEKIIRPEGPRLGRYRWYLIACENPPLGGMSWTGGGAVMAKRVEKRLEKRKNYSI